MVPRLVSPLTGTPSFSADPMLALRVRTSVEIRLKKGSMRGSWERSSNENDGKGQNGKTRGKEEMEPSSPIVRRARQRAALRLQCRLPFTVVKANAYTQTAIRMRLEMLASDLRMFCSTPFKIPQAYYEHVPPRQTQLSGERLQTIGRREVHHGESSIRLGKTSFRGMQEAVLLAHL